MFSFSERKLKKKFIDTLHCSVIWTLIDNGKLANQIARLAAIVVETLTITRNGTSLTVLGGKLNIVYVKKSLVAVTLVTYIYL